MTKVNTLLNDSGAVILNRDPENEGWIAEIKVTENFADFLGEFMDKQAYDRFVGERTSTEVR